MGSFEGHAVPGSFFLIFGVWWTIQTFRRYYSSLQRNNPPFRATVTFQWNFLCKPCHNCDFEGIIIVLFTIIGFVGEIVTAYVDGKFTYLGNGQHATMFFMFGIAGLVTILIQHGLPLPRGMDYMAWAAAVTVQGILFKFHLHGRTDLDVHLHTLLTYVIAGNLLAILVEMRYRHSVCAVLARCYFVFLQGSWFWQMGWILYNPLPGAKPWDETSHEQMLIITMLFAWHMIVILVFMLVMSGIIGCVYHKKYGKFDYFPARDVDSVHMNLIQKDSNGHTVINFHDDSESDVEYERPPNGRLVHDLS